MSLPTLLNPQTPKVSPPSLPLYTPLKPSSLQTRRLKFPIKLYCLSSSSPIENNGDDVEEHVIGDCIVFEEGIFEDPYLKTSVNVIDNNDSSISRNNDSNKKWKANDSKRKKKAILPQIKTENLVPDDWREQQAEINITKKERRKIAHDLQFNSRVERRNKGLEPIRNVNMEEYKTYREVKLAQLNPLFLDNPLNLPVKEEEDKKEVAMSVSSNERVAPKNPRWAVYGRGFDDVNEFFNSGNYVPGPKKREGKRKLFTKEEKVLLNKRIPDVAAATSHKWLPLHTLAASGEFYLVNTILKHNVDINGVDSDGLTALHKAIIGRKQAITNYLLRESASPFIKDAEGATLMHYAVLRASSSAIKLLLLYNVDINLQDNDGWTPLHLAVQAQRSDIVKLLLIKGADKTIKNKDGLTPLDLCLYYGRDPRNYELIKLLKQLPKRSTALARNPYNLTLS